MDLFIRVYRDEVNIEALKKFKEEHKHSLDSTAIGGKFSYIVTPTSIGQSISIRCNECSKVLDLTRWENF